MLRDRATDDELMDDPALGADTYTAVLHDLAQVNTVTLARRPTLRFLERAIGTRASFTLLDVGFGDGDMLRAIARWAGRRGIAARLVGIDLNPRSVDAARQATPGGLGIDYRTGDYAGLAGEGWDFVVSSLVAHHMSHDQLVAFLRFMEREAVVGWLVNDLHRHGFPYAGWPLLAGLMRWHPVVRRDGHLSIARSYRPREWPPILAEAGVRRARVVRRFPFRLCVESIQ
ncbi:methyltransferase domain-containing protein [Altererythrobacter aerius]|uniref:Methyltransferase domain-containing protein n=1 Tax=Tsuneonella aeria TaxID=1837929 RepID=A0A6I4TFT1_9SPHN|nr:methyltransferase domain-containing protein [Tsuneonella aeria]MXO76201.1 methyltransferase domain-containing protein [Tsuneonella aeria]